MKTVEEQFEVHGYYEELVQDLGGDKWRLIGTRHIPNPSPRPLGSDGRISHTFTDPITLAKGHRSVTIKASQARPLVCEGYAQAICGRRLEPAKR